MNVRRAVISLVAILFRVMLVLAMLLAIYRFAFRAYDFGYRVFAEPPIDMVQGVERKVEIPMGAGAMEIGKILEEIGLIRDARLFYLQERLSVYHGKLQPGTYTLSTTMTPEEMMAVMAPEEDEEEED